MTNINRSTDTNNYDGPTLHELLNEIILEADGPISIGDISLALLTRADPTLFRGLADDIDAWNAVGNPKLTMDESEPDYITPTSATSNKDQPTPRPAYHGPTLHDHLDEIILGAEGPISIGEVIYKLLMNSEPELFFALGQELQYIRDNSDGIIPTLIEENPDYITRYVAEGEQRSPNTGGGTIGDQPAGYNDELTLIESGQAFFDITKSIIEEADGSIAVSDLVAEIFKRSEPELFYKLGDERFDWEDEYKPEISWSDDTIDLMIYKEPPAASPAPEYDDPSLPEIFEAIFATGDEPLTSLELTELFFEASPPGLFERLAAEHNLWVSQGCPEIDYGDDTSEWRVTPERVAEEPQPESEVPQSVRVEDKLIPLHFLIETINLLGTGFKTMANTHPHLVVTEAMLASAAVIEQTTTGLLKAIATINEEEGNG